MWHCQRNLNIQLVEEKLKEQKRVFSSFENYFMYWYLEFIHSEFAALKLIYGLKETIEEGEF